MASTIILPGLGGSGPDHWQTLWQARDPAAPGLPPAGWGHPGPRGGAGIAGAFLVAPPDPASPGFPPEAAGFRPVPEAPLPFPALVVASRDDPYDSEGYGARIAAACRAARVVVV